MEQAGAATPDTLQNWLRAQNPKAPGATDRARILFTLLEALDIAVPARLWAPLLAGAASKSGALKEKAGAVAISVAQKIGGGADTEALLRLIEHDPVKVEILKATYGAGGKQKDVTAILKKHVGDLPLIGLPSANYNGAFGGDPAPSVPKTLKVRYRMDGKEGEVELKENAPIILPVPK